MRPRYAKFPRCTQVRRLSLLLFLLLLLFDEEGLADRFAFCSFSFSFPVHQPTRWRLVSIQRMEMLPVSLTHAFVLEASN